MLSAALTGLVRRQEAAAVEAEAIRSKIMILHYPAGGCGRKIRARLRRSYLAPCSAGRILTSTESLVPRRFCSRAPAGWDQESVHPSRCTGGVCQPWFRPAAPIQDRFLFRRRQLSARPKRKGPFSACRVSAAATRLEAARLQVAAAVVSRVALAAEAEPVNHTVAVCKQ